MLLSLQTFIIIHITSLILLSSVRSHIYSIVRTNLTVNPFSIVAVRGFEPRKPSHVNSVRIIDPALHNHGRGMDLSVEPDHDRRDRGEDRVVLGRVDGVNVNCLFTNVSPKASNS